MTPSFLWFSYNANQWLSLLRINEKHWSFQKILMKNFSWLESVFFQKTNMGTQDPVWICTVWLGRIFLSFFSLLTMLFLKSSSLKLFQKPLSLTNTAMILLQGVWHYTSISTINRSKIWNVFIFAGKMRSMFGLSAS